MCDAETENILLMEVLYTHSTHRESKCFCGYFKQSLLCFYIVTFVRWEIGWALFLFSNVISFWKIRERILRLFVTPKSDRWHTNQMLLHTHGIFFIYIVVYTKNSLHWRVFGHMDQRPMNYVVVDCPYPMHNHWPSKALIPLF